MELGRGNICRARPGGILLLVFSVRDLLYGMAWQGWFDDDADGGSDFLCAFCLALWVCGLCWCLGWVILAKVVDFMAEDKDADY